jgi:hypothetical protein
MEGAEHLVWAQILAQKALFGGFGFGGVLSVKHIPEGGESLSILRPFECCPVGVVSHIIAVVVCQADANGEHQGVFCMRQWCLRDGVECGSGIAQSPVGFGE